MVYTYLGVESERAALAPPLLPPLRYPWARFSTPAAPVFIRPAVVLCCSGMCCHYLYSQQVGIFTKPVKNTARGAKSEFELLELNILMWYQCYQWDFFFLVKRLNPFDSIIADKIIDNRFLSLSHCFSLLQSLSHCIYPMKQQTNFAPAFPRHQILGLSLQRSACDDKSGTVAIYVNFHSLSTYFAPLNRNTLKNICHEAKTWYF